MPVTSIDLVSRHSDVLFLARITCPNLTTLKTQWTAPKMLTRHLNEWTCQTHRGVVWNALISTKVYQSAQGGSCTRGELCKGLVPWLTFRGTVVYQLHAQTCSYNAYIITCAGNTKHVTFISAMSWCWNTMFLKWWMPSWICEISRAHVLCIAISELNLNVPCKYKLSMCNDCIDLQLFSTNKMGSHIAYIANFMDL